MTLETQTLNKWCYTNLAPTLLKSISLTSPVNEATLLQHEQYMMNFGHAKLIPILLEIYLIGQQSCLMINEDRNIVQKANMLKDRFAFGVCRLGHHIYVIGGRDARMKYM